jgi:hypothetical protein
MSFLQNMVAQYEKGLEENPLTFIWLDGQSEPTPSQVRDPYFTWINPNPWMKRPEIYEICRNLSCKGKNGWKFYKTQTAKLCYTIILRKA